MNEEIRNESKLDMKDITSDVKEYVNMRIQLIRLNITEKISAALANLITAGAVVIFYILAFIFSSFALCYWIGKELGNIALGFIIVAGIYTLIALLLHFASQKSIRSKLTNRFIDDFTNDEDDDKG